MDYIHIKNLEKYHPGYTERTLIWCRTYFTMLNADPEFEMLPEIDKWRFIAFIMLELQLKKPIPLDTNYLIRKGFNLAEHSISLTLQMLQGLVEICNEDVTQKRVKLEENKVKVDNIYMDFEKSIIELWNKFASQYPSISQIEKIGEVRRKHLKNRYESKHFQEKFIQILQIIPTCKFLMGENKSGWRISFDWLISNDNNYLKILEGRYKEQIKSEMEKWRKEK